MKDINTVYRVSPETQINKLQAQIDELTRQVCGVSGYMNAETEHYRDMCNELDDIITKRDKTIKLQEKYIKQLEYVIQQRSLWRFLWLIFVRKHS